MPHQNYYYPQQGQMPQVPSLSQQLQQIQMEQQSPQAQRFQQSPQAQRYQQAQPLPHQPHQMQGQQSQQLHGPQDQVQAQPQTQSLNGPNGAMNGSHGAMDGTHGTMNGSNGVMAVAQPGLPETPQEPRLMFPNGTPHVVKCGACGFEMRPEMTFLEWLNHCAHGRNYGDDELDYDICVCDVAFMTAKDMQEHQQEYGCKMRR